MGERTGDPRRRLVLSGLGEAGGSIGSIGVTMAVIVMVAVVLSAFSCQLDYCLI